MFVESDALSSVLATPSQLPGFWIFMYRVSPFTYLVDGMLSTGLANNRVRCSSIEYATFQPAAGLTCEQYLQNYLNSTGGYVNNPTDTQNCQYCSVDQTNVYLSQISSSYANRWRNFGIMWAFIIFNIFGALFLYWLARVPKKQKVQDANLEPASRVQTRSEKAE